MRSSEGGDALEQLKRWLMARSALLNESGELPEEEYDSRYGLDGEDGG